jgi:single-strand DNA-binding protein
MMNSFTGIGNLGANPELRTTPSGRAVTNFNMAIDRRFYTGKDNERRLNKETDWVPVVLWNELARTCAQYLQKGSKVCVEGSIRPRQYEDREGVKHSTFEIVANRVHFLDRIRSSEDVNTASTDTGEVPVEEMMAPPPAM